MMLSPFLLITGHLASKGRCDFLRCCQRQFSTSNYSLSSIPSFTEKCIYFRFMRFLFSSATSKLLFLDYLTISVFILLDNTFSTKKVKSLVRGVYLRNMSTRNVGMSEYISFPESESESYFFLFLLFIIFIQKDVTSCTPNAPRNLTLGRVNGDTQ